MGCSINISHGFFLDDVLIMGMLNHFTNLCLFHIFNKFSNASGLYMNAQKSIIYHGNFELDIIAYIKNIFGIEVELMSNETTYLGYHIKPCTYRNADWLWLIDRFFKKISQWEYRIYPSRALSTLHKLSLIN